MITSPIKQLHLAAMDRADEAFDARRAGDAQAARWAFQQAYALEVQAALMLVDRLDAEPDRSVLMRSAATLAVDCGLLAEAKQLIATALAGHPPSDIAAELHELSEQIAAQEATP